MIEKRFRLAPMAGSILLLTLVLWLLPVSFLAYSLFYGLYPAGAIAMGLFALYGIVWVFCRPSCFELSGESMEIIFPGWKRSVPLKDIATVRLLTRASLRQEFGRAMRVGAGGLWGGFGWLWTSKRGMVELYVSRLDGFVLLEKHAGKAMLITPERAEDFAALFTSGQRPRGGPRLNGAEPGR